MTDVYLAKITKESEAYRKELLDRIFEMLNISEDDEEIADDVSFESETDRDNYAFTNYSVRYRGEEVGKISGTVFEDGSFKIEIVK